MSELSQDLKVSNGNVTGIVDRLVQECLVERATEDTDRRAFRIKLTVQGQSVFNAQAQAHADWINELLDQVDKTQADQLSTELETLMTQLDVKETHV